MQSTYKLFEREWNDPQNKQGFIRDVKNTASKLKQKQGNLAGLKTHVAALKKVHKFVDQG